MITLRTTSSLTMLGLFLACTSPSAAKVLFQANFDGSNANAEYALGNPEARAVIAGTYQVAGVVDGGRWGRALDVTQAGANCTYDAAENFDPQRGTAEMWFRLDEQGEETYHPLFGWYRPPYQPGEQKRQSVMEVYLHGSVMVLAWYNPEPSSTLKKVPVEVGRWHHLEINWDGEPGQGQSVYNVFLDGKSVIRVVNGHPLQGGDGAQLHVGIWDYGFGHFMHGKIDEFRITDQVEHAVEFEPPQVPYAKPATIEYAQATHFRSGLRLKRYEAELKLLLNYSGSKGDGAAARAIRTGQGIVAQVEAKLAALQETLAEKDPNVTTLCTAVDAVADQLSLAWLPIQPITAEAVAAAGAEDRRSLLFKDLHDGLIGQAMMLNGRQLFIDDSVVEEIDGARRVMPDTVRVIDEVPSLTRWGGGRLLYDPEDAQFDLWCLVESEDEGKQVLCWATSADTKNWHTPQSKLPLTMGGRVGWYAAGRERSVWFHPEALLEHGMVLSTDRRDRFIAVEAEEAGVLTTRPFIAIGDTLVLNARAPEGEIRVEAIDALGRVIAGFSQAECEPLRGDETELVVSWKDATNCHSLQARPIQLRFYLHHAQLFSFDFRIQHNHYVPNSYSQ